MENISVNNTAPSVSPMTQVGGANAAEIYKYMGEMIEVLNEIAAMRSETAQVAIGAQAQEVIVGRDAQLSNAASQRMSILSEAAGSIAGAVVSLGGAVGQSVLNRGAANEIKIQEGKLGEMGDLKNIQKTDNTFANVPRDANAVNNDAASQNAQSLMRKDFKSVSKDDHQAAVNAMEHDDFKDFQKMVDKEDKSINDKINRHSADRQTQSSTATMVEGFLKGAADAGAKGGQADHTRDATESQAAQQVAQVNAELTKTTSEAAMREVDITQRVDATIQAAKAAAQAYPQV